MQNISMKMKYGRINKATHKSRGKIEESFDVKKRDSALTSVDWHISVTRLDNNLTPTKMALICPD